MAGCIEHGQSGIYGYRAHNDKTVLWHRLAYAEHHGLSLEDIAGKVVRHTCDNPACHNPEHLLLGTQSDNVRDTYTRGRNHNSYTGVSNERHGMCVLSDKQVLEIRELAEAGVSRKELRERYGMSKTQIQRIVTGASRKL